jgi:predicted ribosomally synthesized peptide with nif11-like leader
MTQQQIQALIDAVKTSPELQSKLLAATSFEEAARLAREAGFNISAEELRQDLDKGAIDLTYSELESVAGGNWGQLVKSLANGGDSCGNAVQKLTCNIAEKIEK